jgi:intergrase/recombinase
MKALSNLARFTGRTEQWHQMLQQYQLSWSTGTEKLDAFTRFFDDSKDLDTMIRWLREAIRLLPADYANFFLFCTLTGLRASECIEAVRLLNGSSEPTRTYFNPEQHILQHYKFPELFIRRTKAVYISVVNDQIIGIAKKIGKTPGQSAMKMHVWQGGLSMRLKYCRKIYASWLHKSGISESLIDMLQGRIGKNIFLRHYLTPSSDYKQQVLNALGKLQGQL